MSVTELARPADDFEVPPPARRGPACTVGVVLDGGRPPGSTGDELPPGERERLVAMLDDTTIFGSQISELLREKRGLNVGDNAVARHRRGVCRCTS